MDHCGGFSFEGTGRSCMVGPLGHPELEIQTQHALCCNGRSRSDEKPRGPRSTAAVARFRRSDAKKARPGDGWALVLLSIWRSFKPRAPRAPVGACGDRGVFGARVQSRLARCRPCAGNGRTLLEVDTRTDNHDARAARSENEVAMKWLERPFFATRPNRAERNR